VRSDYASCTVEQVAELFDGQRARTSWSLVSFAARLEEMVGVAAANFEPTHVAKYGFQLAKQFNLFYHSHHILSEPDASRQDHVADGRRHGEGPS
jgi:arginyl-tRNA synthetase